MVKALDALRKRFDVVIVLTLSRPASNEREKRREFLQRARCTGACGSVGVPANGCESLGKLYVASALFHASPQNIISQYLNERKSEAAPRQRPGGVSPDVLPPYFPSLGRLLGVFLPKHGAVAPVTASEKTTLESQCVFATQVGPGEVDGALTEEAVGGDVAESVGERLKKRYHRAYIDWGATTDGRIDVRGLQLLPPAASAGAAGSAAAASFALDPSTLPGTESLPGTEWPNVILLTVNTGANSDRHVTSSGNPVMPGGLIHAAVATSKLISLAEGWTAALADLCAGVAFLAIWFAWGLRLGALPGGQGAAGLAPGRAAQQPWRSLSGLAVALLVLAVVVGTVLLVLGVRPNVAGDIAQAAPHLGYGLIAMGFGLSASAVIWVDGVLFGQNGVPLAKMVWLSRSVRRTLPLAVSTLIALTTVAASLASLLWTAGGHYFDVKVMLIGLLLHIYMEATHDGAKEAAEPFWEARREELTLLRAGPAPDPWRWLDIALRWFLWVVVLCRALYVLACTPH